MTNGKAAEQMAKQRKKSGGDEEVGPSQERLSKRKSKVRKDGHGDEHRGDDYPRGRTDGFVIGELPRKILERDAIPVGGRINTYSRIDWLREITEVLHGTSQYEWLMDSVFGKFFALPTRYCDFSGKLVHQMLCRSLVTAKKHEMWFVFGGKPIRYSLREFAMMTGLNCNPFPPKDVRRALYTPEPGEKPHWETLFGSLEQMSITDIVRMLKNDKVEKRGSKRMSNERKLQLCLVVLIDGVLCNKSSNICATRKKVEMVKDIDQLCEYPWGRRSFLRSMEMVKVGKRVKDPESLAKKLYQSHMSNHGLTMAFHLLAIYTVPLLEAIIPVSKTDSYFSDPKFTSLTKYHPFHNQNVCQVEEDPELHVVGILSSGHSTDEWDLSWDDEVEDERVNNILRGLDAGYNFKPEDWMVHEMRRGFRLTKTNPAKIKTDFSGYGDPEDGSGMWDELLTAIEAINDYHDDRKWQAIQTIDEERRTEIRNLFAHAFGGKATAGGENMDADIKEQFRPSKSTKRKVMGASDIESLSSGEDRREDETEKVMKKKQSKGKKRKIKKTKHEKDEVVEKDVEDILQVDETENIGEGGNKIGADISAAGKDGDQAKRDAVDSKGEDETMETDQVQSPTTIYKDVASIGKDAERVAEKIGEGMGESQRTESERAEDISVVRHMLYFLVIGQSFLTLSTQVGGDVVVDETKAQDLCEGTDEVIYL